MKKIWQHWKYALVWYAALEYAFLWKGSWLVATNV